MIVTFRANGSLVFVSASGKKSDEEYGHWSMETPGTINLKVDDGMPANWSVISLGKGEMIVRFGGNGSGIVSFKLVSNTPQEPSDYEKFAVTPEGKKQRREAWLTPFLNKGVLNNARQLSAAADQYFLENGVSTVGLSDLVGAKNYIKAINTVASETYPSQYTQGMTLTISGVAGMRTITYAP